MKLSENTKELFKALSKAKEQLVQPKKDAKNPFFKSNYVTLEGVIKSVDDAIKGTGISYIQMPITQDNKIGVSTIITHESGEYFESDPLVMPVSKNDAQGYGSAETYARRYSLSAIFGVSSDMDDDGNQASQPTKTKQTTHYAKQSKPASNPSKPLASDKQKDELKTAITKLADESGTDKKAILTDLMKKAKTTNWNKMNVDEFNAINHELKTEKMEFEDKQRKESKPEQASDELFDTLGV